MLEYFLASSHVQSVSSKVIFIFKSFASLSFGIISKFKIIRVGFCKQVFSISQMLGKTDKIYRMKNLYARETIKSKEMIENCPNAV